MEPETSYRDIRDTITLTEYRTGNLGIAADTWPKLVLCLSSTSRDRHSEKS